MKDFTFGILAYKQEDYIIEHLETIKYQIEHYGKDYNIHLVLADDCSPDNTVSTAQKWLDINNHLFKSVRIVVADKNQGIVKNMISLLKNIKTDHCKLLAGDDLYYKNNIFNVFCKNDVVITPTYSFSDINTPIPLEEQPFSKRFSEILFADDVVSFIKDELQYRHVTHTPGMFYKSTLFTEAFFDELSKEYSWIEDVPMWNFIFNLPNLKGKVLPNIFILYRSTIGISTNKNHALYRLFKQERKKIHEKIYTKAKFPYDRIHKLKVSIKRRLIKYYFVKHNPHIQAYEAEKLKTQHEIISYLQYISEQVNRYHKMQKQ